LVVVDPNGEDHLLNDQDTVRLSRHGTSIATVEVDPDGEVQEHLLNAHDAEPSSIAAVDRSVNIHLEHTQPQIQDALSAEERLAEDLLDFNKSTLVQQHPKTTAPASSMYNMAAQWIGLTSLDRKLRQMHPRQWLVTEADDFLYWLHIHYVVLFIHGFLIFLLVSFMGICRHLRDSDSSAALFYSQATKGQEELTCDSADPDALLQAFNQPPCKVHLRIIGHRPDDIGGVMRIMNLARKSDDIAFDVELDLAPFMARIGEISEEDVMSLAAFSKSQNTMEILTLSKRVEWEGWQELSGYICKKLRELNFTGNIDVSIQGDESVHVLHNTTWPKFLRYPLTQVLLGATVVGGLIFLPYIILRSKRIMVKSCFKIDIKPERYWDLIGVGISAEKGFHLK